MGLIFVLVTTSNFLTHIFPTGYKVILKTPTFRTTTIVSYTKQTLPNTYIKMKWLYVIASVALFASAYAYETEEEGEARLGYEEPAYQEPATGYGAGYAKRSL